MPTERDVDLADGRTLHVYDTAPDDPDRLAVFWHHGTPNTGPPPEPLFPAADRLGIRWVSYDRRGAAGRRRTPDARRCPGAELRVNSEDGHISILHSGESALAWLHERTTP